jgi:tRNA A37 methylthiotransferase MiaB
MKKILIIVLCIGTIVLTGCTTKINEKKSSINGIQVEIVDIGTFGIELYFEGTPLDEESHIMVIIDQTFEIEGKYLINSETSENLNVKYESFAGFIPTDEFLNYLHLTWNSEANDILKAIKKRKVEIKMI